MQKYICSVFLDPGPITDLPVENANSNQAGFVDALLFLLMLMLLKDVLTFPLKTISPWLVSAFNYQNAADLPWVFKFGFGKLSRNTAGKLTYLLFIICGNLFGNLPWLFIDIYIPPFCEAVHVFILKTIVLIRV